MSDRSAEIVFDQLSIYHPVAVDKYQIWLCHAILKLGDVSDLSVNGSFVPDEYLDDAVIVNGEVELDWIDLLQPQPATKATITFAPGPSIEIRFSSAYLSLQEPISFLEEWLGPLVSL